MVGCSTALFSIPQGGMQWQCHLSLRSTVWQSALAFKPISSSNEVNHDSEVKHCSSVLLDQVRVLSVFSDCIPNVLAAWRALPHAPRAAAYSRTIGYIREWYPDAPHFSMNRGNRTPAIFPQIQLLIQQSLIKFQGRLAMLFRQNFSSNNTVVFCIMSQYCSVMFFI